MQGLLLLNIYTRPIRLVWFAEAKRARFFLTG